MTPNNLVENEANGYQFIESLSNFISKPYVYRKEGHVFSTPNNTLFGNSCAIDLFRVCYLDIIEGELITYDFNGVTWDQVGNAFSLGFSVDQFTVLTKTSNNRIAVLNPLDDNLRAFNFDGTNWSQTGSAFSINVSSSGSDMAAIDSDVVAIANGDSDLLATYSFNGSVWTIEGNSFVLHSFGNHYISKLTSNLICYSNSNLNVLRSYSFDGTNWSVNGNDLSIGSGISSLRTTKSDTVVISQSYHLMGYRFDGANWKQVSRGFEIPDILPGNTRIAPISDNMVLINDLLGRDIYVYRIIEDANITAELDV